MRWKGQSSSAGGGLTGSESSGDLWGNRVHGNGQRMRADGWEGAVGGQADGHSSEKICSNGRCASWQLLKQKGWGEDFYNEGDLQVPGWEKGPVPLEGGKGENQAQRCGRDKGPLFAELRGKERSIQQIFVENLSLPGTVLGVRNKTDKMLVLEFTS